MYTQYNDMLVGFISLKKSLCQAIEHKLMQYIDCWQTQTSTNIHKIYFKIW